MLQKIGYAINGDSLNFRDIESFIRVSGYKLTMQEIELLIHLSKVFLSEFKKYGEEENKNIDPPFMTQAFLDKRNEEYMKVRKAEIAARNAAFAANKEREANQ